MNYFLRFGAYLWHPLLMPLLGSITYYLITPRYLDTAFVESKLIAVVILTLFIPITSYFLMRNIGWVQSIKLEQVWERKVPLMLQSVLILAIIRWVFDPYLSPELYYFFVGVLFSTLAALLMVFFRIKVSLHQMGIAGLTFFVMCLSIHFKVNMLVWIALFLFANGWVASSRLHTYSHTYQELIIGFFFGIIPQVIVLNYWL